MKTKLNEATATGVFVEFCDVGGLVLGQALFVEWRGRPLPGVGDVLSCRATSPTSGAKRTLRGRVRERHFEVQRDEQNEPCVWVRLVVETPARRPAPSRMPFSAN